MRWFKEHLRLSVLLGIAVLLLTLTVASYVNEGSNSWIGGKVSKITAFIQEPITATGNGIADVFRGLFQFRKIMQENEVLEKENEELRQALILEALTKKDLEDLRELSAAMHYVDSQEYYNSVVGTVISTDGSQWYNTFTINVGTLQGVHKNAIVMNGDGLVGRVMEVGSDWAKVISIVDDKVDVSFLVFRDLALIGILSGDGTGGLEGYMLDEEADVIEGDILITSGLELYPRGIPIGKVSKVTWDNDALLRTIEIEPAVNFSGIRKVTVILTQRSKTE